MQDTQATPEFNDNKMAASIPGLLPSLLNVLHSTPNHISRRDTLDSVGFDDLSLYTDSDDNYSPSTSAHPHVHDHPNHHLFFRPVDSHRKSSKDIRAQLEQCRSRSPTDFACDLDPKQVLKAKLRRDSMRSFGELSK